MTATSRRIFTYWLVLLVGALGVGVGAWMLLRREEARLLSKSLSAEEARRTAVAARAQLVAENVELLVGDVEAALLDTLAESPEAGLDDFLDRWERGNPLVRTTFRCTEAGELLRPTAAVTASDDARGFRRRFATKFSSNPPWKTTVVGVLSKDNDSRQQELKVSDKNQAPEDFVAQEAQRQVASNVSNYQSARKETQALAKSVVVNPPAPAGVSSTGQSYGDVPREQEKRRSLRDGSSLDSKKKYGRNDSLSDVAEEVQVHRMAPMVTKLPDRRGWLPWMADGRMHLLGWVQPGGGGLVRGVEIEFTALVSRLGAALPAELSGDEGYVIRDEKGRVLHQAGRVPEGNGAATVRVPLASELLPGWEISAYVAYTPQENSSGGFFLIGALLAAILVAAILAGGSLLLLQAQRSETEAAQKTSFVANVSHEFKTPLTTIRLYSELLEQGRVASEAKRGEYLKTIGHETQRLARLVNNVLDFSRLEQGRKKFERVKLDLAAEVSHLLDTHAPRVGEAGLILKRELPAEPVLIESDSDALGQIVINLLDNACKYAAEGGEVTVALARQGEGGWELHVLDRGPGVPMDHRKRIFEKFHRVDDTLTSEKGGAGLGLSIARQLARGLGGDLRCEAREGAGAAFVLTLP